MYESVNVTSVHRVLGHSGFTQIAEKMPISITSQSMASAQQIKKTWDTFRILEQRYTSGELIVLDGATGTELTARGIDTESHWNGWPAQLYMPKEVEAVHRSYIDVGADILTTNTYGTNKHVMGSEADSGIVNRANLVGARICRDAVGSRNIVVAGSMSTHPPALTNMARDTPLDFKVHNPTKMGAWPTPQKELANYREQARTLVEGGVDLLFLEMIKDRLHGDLLVTAAVEAGIPVVVGLTLAITPYGDVVARDETTFKVADMIHRWGGIENIVGFSVMHTCPFEMETMIKSMRASWDGFLCAYPNQGKFVPPQWVVSNPIKPAEYRELAQLWRSAGANAVGGCCGVTPKHIAEVKVLSADINLKGR
eukprot:CFRG6794T1